MKKGIVHFLEWIGLHPGKNGKISTEQVKWAYRLFLDREPESDEAITYMRDNLYSVRELRQKMLASQEFLVKNPEMSPAFSANDSLPFPPNELIELVAGIADRHWFEIGGILAWRMILHMLSKNGYDPCIFQRVLDLGCGCGRVIRHCQDYKTPAEFHGCDFNPKLVAWCQANIAFARFELNKLEPPTPYANETFDLIYALSVLTHLPEIYQGVWIKEVERLLKPGGLLLFTTHGERYLPRLSQEQQQHFRQGNLVVENEIVPGSNICATYHPNPYVRSKLAGGFSVIDFVAGGAVGVPFQDVYLFKKFDIKGEK